MADKQIIDQRAEALKYMTANKVQLLFDYLGAKLAKDKPSNPNEYILSELNNIQDLRSANKPVTLFSKEDIEIMFGSFDLTGRGYITPLQYNKALLAMGIDPNEATIPDVESFDKSTFVSFLYKEVLKRAL